MKEKENSGSGRGISYASFYTDIFSSLLLTIIILGSGLLWNSTALLADALYSFFKILTGSEQVFNQYIARKPEDWNHNFGHGKVTTFCMGAGAFIVLLAGILVCFLGLRDIFLFIQGKVLDVPEEFSLIVASCAFIYNVFSSKFSIREKSTSVSGIVLLGITCTFLPGTLWDLAASFTAVLVCLYLLWISGKLLYENINELIEASLDENSNKQIWKIIRETRGVITCCELKTRKIGKDIAINACISVHESLNVQEAAEISERVETRLKDAFGACTYVLIRAEPEPGMEFQKKDEIKRQDKIKQQDETKQQYNPLADQYPKINYVQFVEEGQNNAL